MALIPKFSQKQFAAIYKREGNTRELCEALSQRVQERLHQALLEEFGQIVQELNSMGHNLQPYVPVVLGAIEYRDDSGDDESGDYVCDLRLGADTVISTGYRDTVDFDDESWEIVMGASSD